MEEKIILVDKNDTKIGTEEKIKTHKEGKLHRAFSIFIFNSKGELLLQKRVNTKYHTPGLWTNTCCSHPRPGELLEKAIHRRLIEEMGIDCELKKIFSFIYKATLKNNLFEHEYDHVFIGKFDGEPNPDLTEVDDYKWISIDELEKDINKNPKKYTPWLQIIFKKILRFKLI